MHHAELAAEFEQHMWEEGDIYLYQQGGGVDAQGGAARAVVF